jgi:hypothetical protein
MRIDSRAFHGVQVVARHRRMILLTLLSIVASYVVWCRPIPPLWEHAPTAESILVLGITGDGRVVSVDRPAGDDAIARLRVRDNGTGKIISDLEIPDTGVSTYCEQGVVSGDGNAAILGSSRSPQVVIVSLQNGALLHPPVSPATGRTYIGSCSPDGTYVVVTTVGDGEFGTVSRLLDLKTGEFSWACEPDTQFSPDSQLFLCYRFSGGMMHVTIRLISDNSLKLSDSVPQYMGGNGVSVCGWSDNRLYVNYGHSYPRTTITERQCWSYATTGSCLSDPRDEPLFRGRIVNSQCYASRVCKGEIRGEYRYDFRPEIDSIASQIRNTVRSWGMPIESWVEQDSWQPLTRDGATVGARVEGLRHGFKTSADGKWLAAGGNNLRVWKLPAYRSLARWCYVFLAASAPWGLWWILRRRTKGLKARQPDTPENAA